MPESESRFAPATWVLVLSFCVAMLTGCPRAKVVCPQGQALCGAACVDLQHDKDHCGACGTTCAADQVCTGGLDAGGSCQTCASGDCSNDILFDCVSTGQLRGIRSDTLALGAIRPLGTASNALALSGQTLLSVDSSDERLYEFDLASLTPFTEAPRVEQYASHLLVDGPFVYVTNNGTGTLDIFQAHGAGAGVTFPDAGVGKVGQLDGGLGLVLVSRFNLGEGSGPAYVTKLDNTLYVTLAGEAPAGQRVARVGVQDPLQPVDAGSVDLTVLDLKPFAGQSGHPSPWGITPFQGKVYVALENNRYDPGSGELKAVGNALLAKVDPHTGAVSSVDLGSDTCLEPAWVAPSADGTQLYVGCAGEAKTNGPPHYNLTSVDRAGLLVVSSTDQRLGAWTSACTSSATGADTCNTFSPSFFSVKGSRLFIGDNSFGRAVVLDHVGSQLLERAGFADGGAPLRVCPLNGETGNGNVSYVLAVP